MPCRAAPYPCRFCGHGVKWVEGHGWMRENESYFVTMCTKSYHLPVEVYL